MKPWSPLAAKPPELLMVPVDVPSVVRSKPFVLVVGLPTNSTSPLSTNKLERLPYANPGGMPLHVELPFPPKSAVVVRLPQVVEDGSPAMSKVAEVTSAP